MSFTDDSCCVSLFDFIPEPDQAAIRARTSTTDMTAAIQSAIDHVANGGGGCLCLPAGTYQVNGTIFLKKKVTLVGTGQRGSILSHTGTGNCLESLWPINSSTAVHIVVRSLGIINTAGASNTGSGIYEQGGSLLAFEDLLIENFKYGITLNQTEVADIDQCTIQLQRLASVWLVNGVDITPTAATHFTNRISVNRCQLNGAYNGDPNNPQGFCILDDGGVCHAFRDNNYNGSVIHIRAASTPNLLISGGEFEGAGNVNVQFNSTRLSGGGVGGVGAVVIENCGLFPMYDRPSVEIGTCDHLTLIGNAIGSTHTTRAAIVGMNEANKVTEIGTAIDSSGPLFEHPGIPATRLFAATAGRFGSTTYDPPSLARGASDTIRTMTVTGVQPGDPVEDVSFSADSAGMVFHAWVSAADTVSYFAENVGGANPTDLPSGTLRVKVRRRVF